MSTIVDVHSHAWNYPAHFTDDFRAQARRARAGREVDLTVRYEQYRATVPADTDIITVVFGGKAKRSGLWVEDEYVADYVAQHPDTLIGFLSVDPTQPDFYRELRHGHETLGLQGVKLLPMYAGFRPDDRRLDPLWRYAQRNRLPVLLHTGTT
ncbi:MAG: amidohydrolase family protein, partial [Phycisphaeraceae bacterium]